MSFKTIATLLLLSCLGATGTSLQGVLEGSLEEEGVNAAQTLIITEVRWLWTDTSTNLQICTAVDQLLPVGKPGLVFKDETHAVINIEGFIDEKPNCANFSKEGAYKLDDLPSRYELIIKNVDNPSDYLGRGITTFAITVRTTKLTCDNSQITKITWSAGEVLSGVSCLVGSAPDTVCYHEEDLAGTEFCFSVNDGGSGVHVCLNGPIDNTAPYDGIVAAKYFYYGDGAVAGEDGDATLSLIMKTAGLTNLRAIVRLAEDHESPRATQEATIYDCELTECTFQLYPRKTCTYELCVDAMDDSKVTIKTATTAFTDMNLHAFDGGSQLVEMAFANALENRIYKASLYLETPPNIVEGSYLSTINIDCTSVDAGHACFGFLDAGDVTDTVHVAVSKVDGTNTIIVPFNFL